MKADTRTALYRHWSKYGQLLYVGVSLNAVNRLSQHAVSSGWHKDIAKVEIEWFESRSAALIAEKLAIKKERPEHNKMHRAENESRLERAQQIAHEIEVYRLIQRGQASERYVARRTARLARERGGRSDHNDG